MGYKSGGLTQKHGAWGAYDDYFTQQRGYMLSPSTQKQINVASRKLVILPAFKTREREIYTFVHIYMQSPPRPTIWVAVVPECVVFVTILSPIVALNEESIEGPRAPGHILPM